MLTFIVTFLNLHGLYLGLAFAVMTVGLEKSQLLSYPIKGAAIVLMIIGITIKAKKIRLNKYNLAFFIFVLLYLLKIGIEFFVNNPFLRETPVMLLVFFMAHAVLPFFFYMYHKTPEDYMNAFNGILLSGSILSILFFFLYSDLLFSGVGRIGNWRTAKITDDMTISPLALSYSSSTTFIMAIIALITFQVDVYRKAYYILAILVSIPSILLGASRAPLAGFLLAVFIYFYSTNFGHNKDVSQSRWQTGNLRSSKKAMKFLLPSFILLFVYIFYELSISYESRLVSRLSVLFEGGQILDDTRIQLLRSTFEQFLESPIIGGSIQNDLYSFYPHNIYVESLTATGLFGFLALAYLTISGFICSANIFRYDENNTWIGIMFIFFATTSFFTGSIYLNVGFWLFLGMVLGNNQLGVLANKRTIVYKQ